MDGSVLTESEMTTALEATLMCLPGDAGLRGRLRSRGLDVGLLAGAAPQGCFVLLCASEAALAATLDRLPRERCRILALSEESFVDRRLDASVYAYLPPATPITYVQRIADNAVAEMRLVEERVAAERRLGGVAREIGELNKIGAALSAEHDMPSLLALILRKSREITQADAGSLYIIEERPTPLAALGDELAAAAPEKRLRFVVAQNDSIELAFREMTMAIDESSIAGYVAKRGELLLIDDCYNIRDEEPYRINRQFDADSGYRTKSILAAPMRNAKGEVVGVVQLINAKRNWAARLTSVEAVEREVTSFTDAQGELVVSLASQAAVAYENSRLYQSIQQLFEGFVKAAALAIEQRDPTTSGHSFRVANLTVALAEAVDADSGAFASERFSREQMREMRYASLLHDFGKVGVREQVLVKAKKLYPNQLDNICLRFELARSAAQREDLKQRLALALELGREGYLAEAAGLDEELDRRLAKLDTFLSLINQYNEPTVLPEGSFEQLALISGTQFEDSRGQHHCLLHHDEARRLSIRKGSLDDEERREIELHVVHTYEFLRQIPWTAELRHVPQIARYHHELGDGRGYPRGLTASKIPLQSRMMTVADVFDALSAADRPYKKAVPVEKALDILQMMVDDGQLDGALVRIFREAGVYRLQQREPKLY